MLSFHLWFAVATKERSLFLKNGFAQRDANVSSGIDDSKQEAKTATQTQGKSREELKGYGSEKLARINPSGNGPVTVAPQSQMYLIPPGKKQSTLRVHMQADTWG